MEENNIERAFQELIILRNEIYDLLLENSLHLLNYAKEQQVIEQKAVVNASKTLADGKSNYDFKRWFPGPFTRPIIPISEQNKKDFSIINNRQANFYNEKNFIRLDEFETFYLVLNKSFASPDIIGIGFVVPNFARNFSHAINVSDHTKVRPGLLLTVSAMILRLRDLSPSKIRNNSKFQNIWELAGQHIFGNKLRIASIYTQIEEDNVEVPEPQSKTLTLKRKNQTDEPHTPSTQAIKLLARELSDIKKETKSLHSVTESIKYSFEEQIGELRKLHDRINKISSEPKEKQSEKPVSRGPDNSKQNNSTKDESSTNKNNQENHNYIQGKNYFYDGEIAPPVIVDYENEFDDELDILNKEAKRNLREKGQDKQNIEQLRDRLIEIRNEIRLDYEKEDKFLVGYRNLLNGTFIDEIINNKIKSEKEFFSNTLIAERYEWNKGPMSRQYDTYWYRIQKELDNTDWGHTEPIEPTETKTNSSTKSSNTSSQSIHKAVCISCGDRYPLERKNSKSKFSDYCVSCAEQFEGNFKRKIDEPWGSREDWNRDKSSWKKRNS